ncbi:MAG: preprotein translocase subunit SecE [Gemmatimonadetes bacterium]|nr:preprotein translocase subunit SecE [Gemmatimonadota bacterium]
MEQAQAAAKPNKVVAFISTTRQFLTDVRAEMSKVTWPTKPELTDASRRVIIMTLVLGSAIGILDFLLQKVFFDGVAALAR